MPSRRSFAADSHGGRHEQPRCWTAGSECSRVATSASHHRDRFEASTPGRSSDRAADWRDGSTVEQVPAPRRETGRMRRSAWPPGPTADASHARRTTPGRALPRSGACPPGAPAGVSVMRTADTTAAAARNAMTRTSGSRGTRMFSSGAYQAATWRGGRTEGRQRSNARGQRPAAAAGTASTRLSTRS